MEHTLNHTTNEHGTPSERKPYVTPDLADLGSIAEITQGAAGEAGTDNVVYS